MPRNQITKEELKAHILQLKSQLCDEHCNWNSDPKGLAHKYLNMVLDKIEEYRY
jgi:hypothetical protein